MNIAILIPELGGGGAERVSQVLGDYFVEKGDIVYYFIADTDIKQEYQVKGKVIKTDIKSCLKNNRWGNTEIILKLVRSSIKMRELKNKYKIDVAISFMEEFNYINILSKGKEKVITRVCTILSQRKELTGFLYRKKIVRFFYSKADKVVVMSNYALQDMHCQYGIGMEKLVKIPNPVRDKELQESTKGWEYGERIIMCVGRLETVKQQDRIIRAFYYVVQKEQNVKLLILGKGSNLNYLKGLCSRYQIGDKVVFVGFTNDVSFYLQHARVFVMASKVEGFPNSMVEAMNFGVPVITTDSPGGCGEIVGRRQIFEENGGFWLCEYGILTPCMRKEVIMPCSKLTKQEITLGEAILKVLQDDNLYADYRERSYKRAGMYHIDKIIKKWNCIMKRDKR